MERILLFTFRRGIEDRGHKLRSRLISAKAATDLDTFPESNARRIVTGKLLGVSKEGLIELSNGNDNQVMINERDAAYRFIKISDGGDFQLLPIEP